MHAHTQTTTQLNDRLLDGDPVQWLSSLNKVLDEQAMLCQGLEALSREQSQFLSRGDTDALLVVLERRQPIVDRIMQINQQLEPFRVRRDVLLARLKPLDRDGVVQRVAKIAALVESVRARDDQDRVLVERMRGAVTDELAGLSRARGAAAAYASSGAGYTSSGPRFQDRQG